MASIEEFGLTRRATLAKFVVVLSDAAEYFRPEDVAAKAAYKKLGAWAIKGGSTDALLVFRPTLEAELKRAEQAKSVWAPTADPKTGEYEKGPIYRLAALQALSLCVDYACGDYTVVDDILGAFDDIAADRAKHQEGVDAMPGTLADVAAAC